MIKDRPLITRYAEAFISCAKKEIGLDRTLVDLRIIKDLIRDNPEFKEFLEVAHITIQEKEQLIGKVLGDQISAVTMNFLKLLLENKRIVFFMDIAEYLRFTYAHEGEEEVILRSSLPLDLDLIKQIEDKLAKKYQKRFKFYLDLDGSLLGGIEVIIGNTILDGSIQKRLDDLKDKFKNAEVYE